MPKKELGQYYTESTLLLEKVCYFTRNKNGLVLEPSCGKGHIIRSLIDAGESRHIDCVEIDTTVQLLDELENSQNVHHEYKDFFDFVAEKSSKKYSTIVGNPPYVKQKKTRNIFVDFVDKCIDLLDEDGELVFIIPSDFWLLTSATDVKKKMIQTGMITDVFLPANEQLFTKATQDVMIFRFVKNNNNNTLTCSVNGVPKRYVYSNGNIFFLNVNSDMVTLGSLFDIKVGMVTGADSVFKNEKLGNTNILTLNGIKNFIYQERLEDMTEEQKSYLYDKKEMLMSRKIKKFDEKNWFQWGAPRNVSFMQKEKGKDCLYCATLTRKTPVFSRGKVNLFDGSLLCLFPKKDGINLDKSIAYLNSKEFLEHFNFAGRYKLGQKILMDVHVPGDLAKT